MQLDSDISEALSKGAIDWPQAMRVKAIRTALKRNRTAHKNALDKADKLDKEHDELKGEEDGILAGSSESEASAE